MRIFLSGGEKGSHRSLLLNSGVTNIALNITHFAIPKRKELDLKLQFPGVKLAVYSSVDDEDIGKFDQFVRAHHDDIEMVIGRPDYNGDWLGLKYIPVWSDDQDLERLAWICQSQGRVAISDKAISSKTSGRIKSLATRWGAKLVGITSKPDVIDALPWDSVIVSSWTSAIRYGETQVWDGHGLRRYPAQQKESSRRRHRADIIRLGIDFDAVMEDNVQEIGKLAIRSWQCWETGNMAYDPQGTDDEGEIYTSDSTDIVDITDESHTPTSPVTGGTSIAISAPNKRHESEKQLLPVMGIETVSSIGTKTVDMQGESIELEPETVPILRFSGSVLRQCDSCYLSSRCPAFKEHSECGYNIPVEIRTKDQLQAALKALLEMQVSRILFARFAEELEGQGLDPAVSKEIDRFYELVNKFKNISDSRELVRMEIETRGSSGVLSRLFGSKVGEASRSMLSVPVEDETYNRMALDIIDMDEG